MDDIFLILRGEPFSPSLDSTPGFIKCQIRDRWLVADPEEWVRQEVLAMLKQELSAIHPQRLGIFVETKDIDITLIIRPRHPDFQPPISPLCIIETKHRGIEPVDTESNEEQLFGYMRRTGCLYGVLVNGRSLLLYTHVAGDFNKRHISDADHLMQVIVAAHTQAEIQLSNEEKLFNAARRGHFQSFQQLAERYGKQANATIRFQFEQKGKLITESGFLFRSVDEMIQFMPRGGEQRKRTVCSAEMFRGVLSIATLTY
jgi:hypothetical protein